MKNRKYIVAALEAILEDVTGYTMRLSGELEFEPFFDQPQFDLFKALVREEFGLPDDTLVESCDRMRELIILLEDELFC